MWPAGRAPPPFPGCSSRAGPRVLPPPQGCRGGTGQHSQRLWRTQVCVFEGVCTDVAVMPRGRSLGGGGGWWLCMPPLSCLHPHTPTAIHSHPPARPQPPPTPIATSTSTLTYTPHPSIQPPTPYTRARTSIRTYTHTPAHTPIWERLPSTHRGSV